MTQVHSSGGKCTRMRTERQRSSSSGESSHRSPCTRRKSLLSTGHTSSISDWHESIAGIGDRRASTAASSDRRGSTRGPGSGRSSTTSGSPCSHSAVLSSHGSRSTGGQQPEPGKLAHSGADEGPHRARRRRCRTKAFSTSVAGTPRSAAASGQSSLDSSSSDVGGSEQQSIQACLDFIGNAASYTPSYVESNAASKVSSKRSSINTVETSKSAKEACERLEEGEKHHAIQEEEGYEESDGDAGEAALTLAEIAVEHRLGQLTLSRSSSIESWEEWRAEFPLEVLDELADFYGGAEPGADGYRALDPADLAAALAGSLGLEPAAVLQELEACRAASGDGPEGRQLRFLCLAELLDLARGTLARLEREQEQLLWSREDLEQMEFAVLRHANAETGCVASCQLFEVIREFGFASINVEQPEQQRLIADATRSILQGRGSEFLPGSPRGRPTLNSTTLGHLSAQDIIGITGMVLRSVQRERRRAEFQRERRARREAGFSHPEVEDLRELFRTFTTIDVHAGRKPVCTRITQPAQRDALARLTLLLGFCGIHDLSEMDVRALEAIVTRRLPADDTPPGSVISFEVFMLCMHEVLAGSVGHIRWCGGQEQDSDAGEQLAGRSGFGAFMLRERLCRERQRQAAAVRRQLRRGFAKSVSVCSHRQSSGSREPRGGEGNKRSSTCSELRISRENSESQLSSPSRRQSSECSESRTGERPASRQCGQVLHSARDPQLGAHSLREWRPSQPATRRDSGRPWSSRQPAARHAGGGGGPLALHPGDEEAAALSCRACTGIDGPADASGCHADEKSQSVFFMKGLPPSEVMLGRKEFRACSVELGLYEQAAVESGGAAEPKPLLGLPPKEALACRSLDAEIAQPQEIGRTPSNRKVKRVQDSLAIVNNAIAKLAEQKDDNDNCSTRAGEESSIAAADDDQV